MVSLERHLTLENSDFSFWLHKIMRRINMQIYYLYHLYKVKDKDKESLLKKNNDEENFSKKKEESDEDIPVEEEKKVIKKKNLKKINLKNNYLN